jgi:hypothetical protein
MSDCVISTEVEINELKKLVQEIDDALIAGHLNNRLLMTDDIKDMKELRARAVAGNSMFFGSSPTDEVQAKIDSLIRVHKDTILGLMGKGEEQVVGLSKITADEAQGAFLVVFIRSGMSFFIAPHPTKPRRANRYQKLDHRMSDIQELARNKRQPVKDAVVSQMKTAPKKDTSLKNTAPAPGTGKKTKKAAPVKRRKFVVVRKIGAGVE